MKTPTIKENVSNVSTMSYKQLYALMPLHSLHSTLSNNHILQHITSYYNRLQHNTFNSLTLFPIKLKHILIKYTAYIWSYLLRIIGIMYHCICSKRHTIYLTILNSQCYKALIRTGGYQKAPHKNIWTYQCVYSSFLFEKSKMIYLTLIQKYGIVCKTTWKLCLERGINNMEVVCIR